MTSSTDSLAKVATLQASWFSATNAEEQRDVLSKLVDLGTGKTGTFCFPAVSLLIELCHLTRHGPAKIPIIEAMGHCIDQAFVVPALIGELDHPNDHVVAAALDSLGHVGCAFGGHAVSGWLEEKDTRKMPEFVVAAACLALARTGLVEAPAKIEDAWKTNCIS
ncbi:MAG: hypothetical protein HN348_27030, partial [Proteobacteria bacterium]|nr:hypothetical protein [Pseudomonadota bacterium]